MLEKLLVELIKEVREERHVTAKLFEYVEKNKKKVIK